MNWHRFPLAHAILRCLDEDDRLAQARCALFVDLTDKGRKKMGIPSIFGPWKTHRGEWIES